MLAETETVGLESVVCEWKRRRGKAKETRKRNGKSKWGLVDHSIARERVILIK